MLLPYTEHMLSLNELPAAYLANLWRDAAAEAFSGLLLFLGERQGLGLIFSEGTAVAAYHAAPGGLIAPLDCSYPLAIGELPPVGRVELLGGDGGISAMAWRYLARAPLWRRNGYDLPESFVGADGAVASGVLARLKPWTLELAYVEAGQIVFGYAFDAEEGAYKRQPGGFWINSGEAEASYEFVTLGELQNPAPRLEDAVGDPLALLVSRYQNLLGSLGAAIYEETGEAGRERLSRLLAGLHSKYQHLYRGVYVNPETGQINWDQLLANRERVKRKYRYDKFLLYFDEVVLGVSALLLESAGAAGAERFERAWLQLRQAERQETALLRGFYEKLPSFRRKLGQE